MSPSLNIGARLPRRYFFYRKCGLASPINELLRKFLMRNKHATTKSGLTCCFEVGLSRVLFLIKTATTFAEQLLIHEHMLPPEQCGSQMTSSCTILQFVSMADLHYRITWYSWGSGSADRGIAIENVWRARTARYKASCSSWSRR